VAGRAAAGASWPPPAAPHPQRHPFATRPPPEAVSGLGLRPSRGSSMSTGAPQAPARTKASDRVARMLAMVPWIASHDGPTVDEICDRFQVGRRKLLEDLEVLSLVGVPPYTPDTLIEVTIEGDRVWLRFADFFARPLHLTPEQGLALVVAGRASQALPGTEAGGPLATALAKVAAGLGGGPDDAGSVAL